MTGVLEEKLCITLLKARLKVSDRLVVDTCQK